MVTVSPVWHVYSLLIYFLRNVDFPEAINHLLSLSIVNLLVKVEDAETYICIAIIRWSRVRRIGWIMSCVHPFTAGHYGSIAKPQRPGWSRGSLSELRTSLNWSFHFTFLRNPQRSATVDPFHTWKWMCVCVNLNQIIALQFHSKWLHWASLSRYRCLILFSQLPPPLFLSSCLFFSLYRTLFLSFCISGRYRLY